MPNAPPDSANPLPTHESASNANVPTEEEDEDDDAGSEARVNKDKLDRRQLAAFGFNDVDDWKPPKAETVGHAGGGAGGGTAKKAKTGKTGNETVVYGDVDDDDDTDDFTQDYDDGRGYIPTASDGTLLGEEESEATLDDTEQDAENAFEDLDYLWEDEEDEEEQELDEQAIEEAERQALYAAELERERIRNVRMVEILKKKEDLIERYLKTARIMINLRKKNIYLQDYLYHLAFRKGVLRGDPVVASHHANIGDDMEDENATESQINLAKLQKKRMQKKNTLMAARFARFLRKTGHLFDEEGQGHMHHHHHPHGHINRQNNPDGMRKSKFNIRPSQQHHHHHHHHNKTKMLRNKESVLAMHAQKKACLEGAKECQETVPNPELVAKEKAKAKKRDKRNMASVLTHAYQDKKERKPLTVQELIAKKENTGMKKALKNANEALELLEHHRCKLKRQKQLIKITKLLTKQYSGLALTDQERYHLVHFVEQSVVAQNLAKRKALRRQQKNQSIESKKAGSVNMNHSWTKSLERIRDLRLKKAKLEQEHRLLLVRKVHQWNIWEKRDLAALESVLDFILRMGSRVGMSKRETEAFDAGMDLFRKQLHSLFESTLGQLVRLFKAKSMLHMAQRQVKDNASVATPSVKGFSIVDFKRMVIENQESHQKLMEKQKHLIQQHEKLQTYMGHVAKGHLRKQGTWSILRAGRHDLKQLWEMCAVERDNLLRKFKDLRRVTRIHRRMFVQVAVVENKRIYKDYVRISNRVHFLEDKKRILTTRLHQSSSQLRVLNVKLEDTHRRLSEEQHGKQEKKQNDEMDFFKSSIEPRIHPKVPNTIYSMNQMSRRSLHRLLEPQINQAILNNVKVPANLMSPKPESGKGKKNKVSGKK